jgi:hypothetical protein
MSCQVCLIAPPNLPELAQFASGRFVLHNWCKHEKYISWFDKQSQPYILDNGAFENQLATDEDLLHFSRKHKVDTVIAPDIIGAKSVSSIRRSYAFLDACNNTSLNHKPNVLLSPQCSKLEDRRAIVVMLRQALTKFAGLAISRDFAANFLGMSYPYPDQEIMRFLLFHDWQQNFTELFETAVSKPIHYLGMGDCPFMLADSWWVNSIDTASIIWRAYKKETLRGGRFDKPGHRPANYEFISMNLEDPRFFTICAAIESSMRDLEPFLNKQAQLRKHKQGRV